MLSVIETHGIAVYIEKKTAILISPGSSSCPAKVQYWDAARYVLFGLRRICYLEYERSPGNSSVWKAGCTWEYLVPCSGSTVQYVLLYRNDTSKKIA